MLGYRLFLTKIRKRVSYTSVSYILILKKEGCPNSPALLKINKYRHEHVKITNLYLVLPPYSWMHSMSLLWNTLPLFNQLVFKFGKHGSWEGIPSCTRRPRISQGWPIGDGSDPDGQSRGYDITSLQTLPCHIAGMLALSCWKRKLYPTV